MTPGPQAGPPAGPLPRTVAGLAAVVPDRPRWVETRAMLLRGDSRVVASRDGRCALVIDADGEYAAHVGRVDPTLLGEVLGGLAADVELIVQADAADAARDALPGWRVADVVVHTLPGDYRSREQAEPDVVVSTTPPHEHLLRGLPDDVTDDAAEAEAVAVRSIDGVPVAVCAAGDVTESWWDVGIDTVAGHRRRGHATACFHALAAAMARRGRQPVWSAYADYPPSLALAAALGFRPVDRLAVLTPSTAGTPAERPEGRPRQRAGSSR